MALSRYINNTKLEGGKKYSTALGHVNIRNAAVSGQIAITQYTVQEGERLDSIAGRMYGNSRLWWIISAASGIGWGLQVPPGTLLLIPAQLNQIEGLI
jgi:nucleoid-associated protein YgaU